MNRSAGGLALPKGFTLFELLLTLGIVSVILAMSWPAFEQMFAGRRMVEAAGMVRNTFREARRQAMADGMAYRVDFSPETSFLRIVPDSDPFEEESAQEGERAAVGGGSQEEVFEPRREEFELPDGIQMIDVERFDEGPKVSKEEGGGLESAESEVVAPEDATRRPWEPAVAFFPDGSATPTTVWLISASRDAIVIRVDPLVGEVEMGEVEAWRTKEEREQEEQNRDMGLSPPAKEGEARP